MLKEIAVNLRHGDHRLLTIGTIAIETEVIGAVDFTMRVEVSDKDGSFSAYQIAMANPEYQNSVYLYLVVNHEDRDSIELYWVDIPQLYDDNGYHDSLTVGEQLETENVKDAYVLFHQKALELFN